MFPAVKMLLTHSCLNQWLPWQVTIMEKDIRIVVFVIVKKGRGDEYKDETVN